jgi:hypothetical protein
MALIDGGKWPEWVLRFLQLLARESNPLLGRVRACRGSAQFPHPIIDIRDTRVAKTLKGHWIGTDATNLSDR